ncbi:2-oxoadipate dioxygenase/decarboxylase HglS [Cupriavidus consociatus]|uniref:2-oxoadipate dioxygenase/decarboxylase HglS n=1 Tax=Cupriavidus consociatus TaxID=2821357 RepID=UPI001AE7CBD2|nr:MULTISPECIES: VOC family protein [unclassified Cupriavidus]MBP0625322.1 VOC family protein [Cupriavidus sp. LEh25]MDK2662058.1 VOC family protein [Cupriavidus sp. LEh21]
MSHTPSTTLLHPDEIRSRFARALSDMYRQEVPQYGALLDLVADINMEVIQQNPSLEAILRDSNQLDRLNVERHGAIRVGTPKELSTIARMFGVMGMTAVGYYDLSVANVPVHATAFRPVKEESLNRNPFRVFTSLLRLDLVEDVALRERAAEILSKRRIFTSRALELIDLAEQRGGLTQEEAEDFVSEALETFRWHRESTVDIQTYQALRSSHPLVADVVCFKGPHINHLTPRVLDIDRAQSAMHTHEIRAKATIEGPPRRNVPILLRQTSFLALEEPVYFRGGEGAAGSHTARFGEIEQRGYALTMKGRALYDSLLQDAAGSSLDEAFTAFPDDLAILRKEGLAFFRYEINLERQAGSPKPDATLDQLVDSGWLRALPLTYEDFLPVSAAGIFHSNLGSETHAEYSEAADRAAFEAALGHQVLDEIALYEAAQAASVEECRRRLKLGNCELGS